MNREVIAIWIAGQLKLRAVAPAFAQHASYLSVCALPAFWLCRDNKRVSFLSVSFRALTTPWFTSNRNARDQRWGHEYTRSASIQPSSQVVSCSSTNTTASVWTLSVCSLHKLPLTSQKSHRLAHRPLQLFCDYLLQHVFVQAQISYQFF